MQFANEKSNLHIETDIREIFNQNSFIISKQESIFQHLDNNYIHSLPYNFLAFGKGLILLTRENQQYHCAINQFFIQFRAFKRLSKY
jgi:hypothetical protein